MKIGLILSNDWELYGNGQGDFFEVQHEPTRLLMDAVERHGAKLTLMAEVGQQWGHQRVAARHRWAQDVADAWEEQLCDAIRRGHDVQLHLHPQWEGARFDGAWHLNYERYAFGELPAVEQATFVRAGKSYLEDLLRPLDAGYDCLAFRAGGLMIEPSERAIRSLLWAGIVCDTSVCKGRYFSSRLGSYDYRTAHSYHEPWYAYPKDIKYAVGSEEGLLEIPIYAEPYSESPIMRKMGARLGLRHDIPRKPDLYAYARDHMGFDAAEERRHLAAMRQREARYPAHSIPSLQAAHKGRFGYFSDKLHRRSSLILSYDEIMPSIAAAMVARLHGRLRDIEPDTILPVMALGHVKSLVSTDYIEAFLTKTRTALGDDLVFWTLREAIDYWQARLETTPDEYVPQTVA